MMQSAFTIDPVGASVASLTMNGIDILWSGLRPDGGKGITHPCIPNFNIAQGLPNHGPARKEEWQKVNENMFNWSMQALEGVYPAGIQAQRTFVLEHDTFTVTTEISNHSAQELPLVIAEHHYFACEPEDRQQVKVNGEFFDKGGLEANAKFLELDGNELRIEIPHKPVIVMTVEGYHAFAQWSQPQAPFVCVEPIQVLPLDPAKFMSDAPKIQSGEKKVFRYSIAL